MTLLNRCKTFEAGNSISYKIASAPSEDSGQTYRTSAKSDQFLQDAQADLSLRLAHIQSYRQYCTPAHLFFVLLLATILTQSMNRTRHYLLNKVNRCVMKRKKTGVIASIHWQRIPG